MNLAIIPARGGSKRIPGKNIKDFCGVPMIVRSIESARNSNLFDHIVVSTDDDDIAEIARRAGGEVPFMRPRELANDMTATVPVIAHAVETCRQLGWGATNVCCIYPCAPLLSPVDLGDALRLLSERRVDFVYPVTEYAHPIQRAMRLVDGRMEFVSPEYEIARTQDLETTYHDCGMFYWGTSAAWLAGKRMHTDGLGMPIPSWRVVDIDSEDDWARAEILFKCFGPSVTGSST